MAYLASDLITRSYYLSGICSRGLEVPGAEQISDGLFLLNELLSLKASDFELIPYYTTGSFNTVVGQEIYFIENLFAVESLTFNIGPVRYSMNEMTRRDYFGGPRVDNIQSIPFTYHVERTLDGSNIYIYFIPNAVYVMKWSGKIGLTNVDLDTDLTDFYDEFYITYLRYSLAKYLCDQNLASFPPQALATLQEITKKLMYVSPPDLTMTKRTTFDKGNRLSWAQINIGQGYEPS